MPDEFESHVGVFGAGQDTHPAFGIRVEQQLEPPGEELVVVDEDYGQDLVVHVAQVPPAGARTSSSSPT